MDHPTHCLGVGLVGWGYASTTFHAPLIRATPGLQLRAVSTRRMGALSDADGPACERLSSFEALLARSDIDLVVIPTPNDSHHALAAQALEAGKHVVVDKPFTLTVAEADDLIARAERAGRLLSVFHNRRWDGDFLGVQQLLASGRLGRVTHVESHFDRYRPQVRARWREAAVPGAGLWYDLGPHLLDQVVQLFGLPQRLWLDVQRQRDGALSDDWFHAVLQYPSARVVLHASALSARVAPRFVLHGTEGSYVKWGLDTQEDALKAGLLPGGAGWGHDPRPGQLTLRAGDGVSVSEWPALSGDYRHFYTGVQRAISSGGQHPPPVTVAQAREVMRLIECGWASVASGAWQSLGTDTAQTPPR